MDLNKIISLEKWFVDRFDTEPINTRAKLDTGKFCNASCGFCYYKESYRTKDFLNPQNAGILVNGLLDRGITEIELSGGEPGVHPDLLELLQTIEGCFISRGMPPKISMVTNGSWSLAKFKKITKYVKEFLISIHGTEDIHNAILKINSFSSIKEKIKWSRKNNIKIRINFVVHIPVDIGTSNLTIGTWRLLKYFLDRNIQVNLLPLNYWEDASKIIQTKDNLAAIYKSINEFINFLHHPKLDSTGSSPTEYPLNIRYPQFCLLTPEAIKYARGHYDHVFDLTDWNKVFYPKDLDVTKNILSTPTTTTHDDYFRLVYQDLDLSKESIYKTVARDRSVSHVKDTLCKNCKHFEKCDGFKPQEDFFDSIRKWGNKNNFDFKDAPVGIKNNCIDLSIL